MLPSRDSEGPFSDQIPDADPPVTAGSTKLAEYRSYADAQSAVDQLSDMGFPVSTISIVWSGLRRVERVTGRRTVVTAALEGAMAGAWFGTLLGLLLASFADLGPDRSVIGVTFTYFVVGAAAGAAWQATSHAFRRGRRDFSTAPMLEAEAYEIWVHPQNYELAVDLLGLRTARPEDPGQGR